MSTPDPGQSHQLYQHIQIFGRPGMFIVRVDNDAVGGEKRFNTYPAALAWAMHYLGQAIIDGD